MSEGAEDGRSAGKRALRVVGGADPYGWEAEASVLTKGRRERGRCGSSGRRLLQVEVKFSPLVPLRYRREKARTGGGTNMPSPVGEGGSQRLTDEAFFPQVRFCRRQCVTPHPPLRGPPVSLRLGHTRALSLPRSEIQSPRAASLPAGEGKGGERKSIRRREVGWRGGVAGRRGRRPLQGKTRTGGGTNMPSPVGEGGSRRLTDEAFFLRARFCRRQHITPHPPLRGPPSPAGEGRVSGRRVC